MDTSFCVFLIVYRLLTHIQYISCLFIIFYTWLNVPQIPTGTVKSIIVINSSMQYSPFFISSYNDRLWLYNQKCFFTGKLDLSEKPLFFGECFMNIQMYARLPELYDLLFYRRVEFRVYCTVLF